MENRRKPSSHTAQVILSSHEGQHGAVVDLKFHKAVTNGLVIPTSLQFLACGAVSGVATKTAVAPLERVKLLYQVQGMFGTARYQSVWGSIATIVREDGWRGLYKGNGANIARILPAYSLKFMFNDSYKTVMLKQGQTVSQMSFLQLLGSGMLAGFSQACITYPLEFIRTRLSLDCAMGGKYKGIVDCGIKTVRAEGVRALYQGFSVTFCSTPLYVGLQMALYDTFKTNLSRLDSSFLTDANTGKATMMGSFMAGACAGLIGQTSAYWGDTIKKQMQSNGVDGKKKYTGVIDCVRKIFRQGGLRAFYPGIALNSVKCIPEAGIQFVAYDALKGLLGLG